MPDRPISQQLFNSVFYRLGNHDRLAVRDDDVQLVVVIVPADAAIASHQIGNEEPLRFLLKGLSRRVVHLGIDVFVGTAELGERTPRLDRKEVGCSVEHPRLVEEGPKRDVLGVQMVAFVLRLGLRDELDLRCGRPLQQQAQPILISQLSDAMEVSREPLRIIFFGSRKEVLQRFAHFAWLLVEDCQIETAQLRLMSLEQTAHQRQIDRLQKREIYKLPQILSHRVSAHGWLMGRILPNEKGKVPATASAV